MPQNMVSDGKLIKIGRLLVRNLNHVSFVPHTQTFLHFIAGFEKNPHFTNL